MKERSKGFLAGVLCSFLVLGCATSAIAAYQKTATLQYADVKITLDGQTLVPKDAAGRAVEPFIIDGTTYLPLRGVASALGLGVSWEQNTKTVKLTTTPAPAGANWMKTGVIWNYVDSGYLMEYLFYPDGTVESMLGIVESEYISGYKGTYTYGANQLTITLWDKDGNTYPTTYSVTPVTDLAVTLTQTSQKGIFYFHTPGTVLELRQGSNQTPADFTFLCNALYETGE